MGRGLHGGGWQTRRRQVAAWQVGARAATAADERERDGALVVEHITPGNAPDRTPACSFRAGPRTCCPPIVMVVQAMPVGEENCCVVFVPSFCLCSHPYAMRHPAVATSGFQLHAMDEHHACISIILPGQRTCASSCPADLDTYICHHIQRPSHFFTILHPFQNKYNSKTKHANQ